MKNINKQVKTQPSSNELHSTYNQVREIQKNMEGALQLLTATYQASIFKVKQSTEHAFQVLQTHEQQVMLKLDAIKDQLIDSVDCRWTEFKQYSRSLRKICLGEQSTRLVVTPDLVCIQTIITNIYERIDSFQTIAEEFARKFPEIEQYIRKKLTDSIQAEPQQSPRPKIAHNFLDISPIREKTKQTSQSSKLQVKQFNTVQFLVQQMHQKQRQRKFKTETGHDLSHSQHNYNHHLQKYQLKPKTSIREPILAQSASLQIVRSPPTKTSKTKRVDPQLQAYQPIKSLDIPKITGTGRLQKFGASKINYMQEEFKAVSPRGFTKRNKQFMSASQKRDDILAISGEDYKNCLQKLQRQQFQYEKLRRGLA